MTATIGSEATGRRVDAAGISTHYHEAGAGPPVLLLHGSGPGVSAWANWRLTIPALARNYRVIAPDLVGFGCTERPGDIRYSLQTWSNHVWSFLDALGIRQTSVVGNSLGGRIGLDMAAHYYNSSLSWNGQLPVLNCKLLPEDRRPAVVEDVERGFRSEVVPHPWQTDTCIGDWHYNRARFEYGMRS